MSESVGQSMLAPFRSKLNQHQAAQGRHNAVEGFDRVLSSSGSPEHAQGRAATIDPCGQEVSGADLSGERSQQAAKLEEHEAGKTPFRSLGDALATLGSAAQGKTTAAKGRVDETVDPPASNDADLRSIKRGTNVSRNGDAKHDTASHDVLQPTFEHGKSASGGPESGAKEAVRPDPDAALAKSASPGVLQETKGVKAQADNEEAVGRHGTSKKDQDKDAPSDADGDAQMSGLTANAVPMQTIAGHKAVASDMAASPDANHQGEKSDAIAPDGISGQGTALQVALPPDARKKALSGNAAANPKPVAAKTARTIAGDSVGKHSGTVVPNTVSGQQKATQDALAPEASKPAPSKGDAGSPKQGAADTTQTTGDTDKASRRNPDSNKGARPWNAGQMDNPISPDNRRLENSGQDVRIVNIQTSPAAAPAAPMSPAANAVLSSITGEASANPAFAPPAAGAVIPGQPRQDAVKSLQIQLNPASLGVVTANLRLAGERLNVDLRVDSAEAHHRLKADSDAIVKSLQAAGFDVDKVTVQQMPSHGMNAGGNQAGAAPGRDQSFQQQTTGNGGGAGDNSGSADNGRQQGHRPQPQGGDRHDQARGDNSGLFI